MGLGGDGGGGASERFNAACLSLLQGLWRSCRIMLPSCPSMPSGPGGGAAARCGQANAVSHEFAAGQMVAVGGMPCPIRWLY